MERISENNGQPNVNNNDKMSTEKCNGPFSKSIKFLAARADSPESGQLIA